MPPARPPMAYIANSSATPSQFWYADSGASHHVTADSHNLLDATNLGGQNHLFVGNGQGLHISSIGTNSFTSPLNSNVQLSLNHLLHVPSITKNLLSVSKFCHDNNVYFQFHSTKCFVKSQVNHQVLLEGELSPDGLYVFPGLLQSASAPKPLNSNYNSSGLAHTVSTHLSSSISALTNTVSTHKPHSYTLWHIRLGHPQSTTVQTVSKLCNIPIINKEAADFCIACCMGKAHRLPSSPSSLIYSTPLELVFSDLWGPAPITSFGGFTYYVTFVDAYSKYTWIYFLKTKSETLQVFKHFKALVELQLHTKIKAFQSDWGGEFRPFKSYLAELGITHRLICPHTHHQNGVIERKHRHIVETGLSLLAHASMPMKF